MEDRGRIGEPPWKPAEVGYFVIVMVGKSVTNQVSSECQILFNFTFALLICSLSHTECQRRK